jgi:polysaccharide export outer membrane protein
MKKTMAMTLFLLLVPALAVGSDYVIGDGDGLTISVWGVQDLSLSAKVRPDGKITIPALGEVRAAGLTPVKLQDKLTEKLKNLVKNPVVTVIVSEITNNKVFVFGGGVKPGVYNLLRKTTLLELLCEVSEVKEADLRRAYVLRDGKKIKEDFYDLFVEGDVSGDIAIEPNDVIFLPALLERNIYIVGAVNKPQAVEYREGMTAMEALLSAEGFTKFAKLNSTVIFRKEGGKEIEIKVKVKDLIDDGDLSQNVLLKPGDYIVVSEGIF